MSDQTEIRTAELDLLVGTKVMGWTHGNPALAAELYTNKHDLLCYGGDSWKPSRKIDDAWLVVERMRELGWHPSVDDAQDLKNWTCTLAHMDGRFVHRGAATAPEAICRAALAALENQS